MKKYILVFLFMSVQNVFASEVAITLKASQISLIQVHSSKNAESASANTAILATTALKAPCSKGVLY